MLAGLRSRWKRRGRDRHPHHRRRDVRRRSHVAWAAGVQVLRGFFSINSGFISRHQARAHRPSNNAWARNRLFVSAGCFAPPAAGARCACRPPASRRAGAPRPPLVPSMPSSATSSRSSSRSSRFDADRHHPCKWWRRRYLGQLDPWRWPPLAPVVCGRARPRAARRRAPCEKTAPVDQPVAPATTTSAAPPGGFSASIQPHCNHQRGARGWEARSAGRPTRHLSQGRRSGGAGGAQARATEQFAVMIALLV